MSMKHIEDLSSAIAAIANLLIEKEVITAQEFVNKQKEELKKILDAKK